MAEIVGVHGIMWNWQSRAQMSELWGAAIRGGLHNRRHDRAAEVAFAPAFYGDLYNDGKGAGPQYHVDDLDDGFETELFWALHDAVAAEQAEAVDPTKVYLPQGIQAALAVLQRTTFFGTATTSLIVRFVKQVHRYLNDTDLRWRIQQEVAAAVDEDTRVLVGHSLGSIVAYEALRNNPDWPVRTLVTLGSPLGLRAVVDRLVPPVGPGDGWPGSVVGWVNIAARQDAVAMVKTLAEVYDHRVDDRLCANPRLRAHDVTWYLKNMHCADALAAALD
ncbi:hypothetical protein [Micromonospora coxensis]|uniref:hypothetical protein n=1 Tax=Micromonospora coxensis TaxID=356852 RepID=UPI0034307724